MITPDFSRGRKVTNHYIKILIFILISLRYEYCTQIRVVRYKIQTVIKSWCLSKSKQLLHIICNCFHQHQMSFKYYQTRSSSSCGGLEALWALKWAFSPLFSTRRCKRRHTQFSVKIGPQRSKQVTRGQNKKGPKNSLKIFPIRVPKLS